ncbi:MAG: flagellar hook protein [Lachnospiraceae bacterium]|nr:flagellar hook protein [Lachnospiraceae bacterium]
MVVQHNLRAMNSNRMLGITQGTLSKSAEKLSSGYKVNRAADDAAGLSISEKMRKQVRGLTQASLNAEDGISAVQTAEGALTEVHDMLQRMNELATKASNGTNALSDRQTIQDEVDQLLTEIDRVSETTKFNEMYLLKGDTDKVTRYLNAKDAGLDGTITQNATRASFTMNALKLGDTITIAGKEYTIGTNISPSLIHDAVIKAVTAGKYGQPDMTADPDAVNAAAMAGAHIDVDGTQYTIVTDAAQENADKNILTLTSILDKASEAGSTVKYNGKTYHVLVDDEPTPGVGPLPHDDIDDIDAAYITDLQAYKMIRQELGLANNIGANKENSNVDIVIKDAADPTKILDLSTDSDTTPITDAKKVTFTFDKGQYTVKEDFNFSLHVGADADMTNKIGVGIKALDTAGLGIDGLNVKDSTGTSATYAIDSISDAIATVSAQRSLLGAVQNRLEHTINNLDNVVENTTAAESQIRDTDMATEMVKYSNANILSQAGQSMLAQSNQANQGVLSLLG